MPSDSDTARRQAAGVARACLELGERLLTTGADLGDPALQAAVDAALERLADRLAQLAELVLTPDGGAAGDGMTGCALPPPPRVVAAPAGVPGARAVPGTHVDRASCSALAAELHDVAEGLSALPGGLASEEPLGMAQADLVRLARALQDVVQAAAVPPHRGHRVGQAKRRLAHVARAVR